MRIYRELVLGTLSLINQGKDDEAFNLYKGYCDSLYSKYFIA